MAKRVVLIALGVVLLVIGALAAIAGGALMALFGSNNTLGSGVQQVSTPPRALVSPADSIEGASGAQTVVGNVRLRLTATPTRAGQHLFLGIGPANAVARYLSGVSYDVATDVSVPPFHLTLTPPTFPPPVFPGRCPATVAPPPHRYLDLNRSGWPGRAETTRP